MTIEGRYEFLDVSDKSSYQRIVKENQINTILHLSEVDPFTSEDNNELARRINIEGIYNALDIATEYRCK
jgi:dTDP-4-dehydrorhamnose reductase